MKRPSRTWGLAASLLLVGSLAACGGDDNSGSGSSPQSSTESSAPTDTPSSNSAESESPDSAGGLTTADTDLGTILVDDQGMTVYLFTQDTQNAGTSTCAGACLEAWPAVPGPLEAGAGVDAAMLGTITRSDGTTQATYNGWPLYYYVEDGAAGDATGQGVDDVWWVMSPQGDAIGQ